MVFFPFFAILVENWKTLKLQPQLAIVFYPQLFPSCIYITVMVLKVSTNTDKIASNWSESDAIDFNI